VLAAIHHKIEGAKSGFWWGNLSWQGIRFAVLRILLQERANFGNSLRYFKSVLLREMNIEGPELRRGAASQLAGGFRGNHWDPHRVGITRCEGWHG
jgi:hypothetical protein